MSRFGELLRSFRVDAGKSMGMLARHMGVSVPYISGVERGRRAPLTAARILETARFLELTDEKKSLLLKTAAEARGFFELDAMSSDAHSRVGAALARSWLSLDEEELAEIEKIVEG